MFTPEQLEAARRMMSNMSPEQMAQMADMASKLDPSMLPKGMPMPSAEQMKQAQDQMKNMSTDDVKNAFRKAESSAKSQASYSTSVSQRLKDEGNALFKSGSYSSAIDKYTEALSELEKNLVADDKILESKVSLLSNIAYSHLKLEQWSGCIDFASQVLASDHSNVKALFRRGVGYSRIGNTKSARSDLEKASALSPTDEAIRKELQSLGDEDDEEIEEVSSTSSQKPFVPMTPDPLEAARLLGSNPDMLSSVSEMMGAMPPGQLEEMLRMSGLAVGDNERKALMEMMQNKDMLKGVTDMMKNMSQEDLMNVVKPTSEPSVSPSLMPSSDMFNDPNAIKSMESMVDALPDSVLESLLTAQNGPNAQMPAFITGTRVKFLVKIAMKLLRLWLFIKSVLAAMFTRNGMIIAALVLLLALIIRMII